MDQELNSPQNEHEFRNIQDELYKKAKECTEQNKKPTFKGLLEIIESDVVIITAIHKLKANKGSKTPGSDGENLRKAFLEKDMNETLQKVKGLFIRKQR